jgi:phage terminase large subunit-like protein
MTVVTIKSQDQLQRKMSRDAKEQQSRAEISDLMRQQHSLKNEILRREIVDNGRIDLLATEVLGYSLYNFHKKIMKFQYGRKRSLTLAPRDSGKSTICNYTKIIFEILRDPNIRIALISNTQSQAEGFLKEIKNHLEGNHKLVEIFGNQVGKKWDTKEIVVSGKTSKHKDSTVSCIGVGSALIGKHFDMIVMDDAVTEEASRTELQRERQRVWFYQTLYPTTEPHAQLHVIGTRYHNLDLYGHFMGDTEFEGAGEFKNDFIRIKALEIKVDKSKPIYDEFGDQKTTSKGELLYEPILDKEGNEILISYFPEKHTVEYLLSIKANMGTVLFNAQYQNDTDAMKGVIFKNQYFRYYQEEPRKLKKYQGVDLAVGEKDSANKFAHVTIGVDEQRNIYVLNFYERRGIRPKRQTEIIAERFRDNDPLWVGIESNAYQEAKAMDVVDFDPTVMVKKVYSDLDKITKGWKCSALFEAGKVFVHLTNHRVFIDHFLLFTGERNGEDDLFDAFFNAVKIAFWQRTKKNRRKFGVI